MQDKKCVTCGISKPETTEYYYYRKDRGKYRNECIECKNKTKRYYEPQYNELELKVCSHCEKEYPKTPEYFHAQPSNKSGIKNKCKTCCASLYKKYRGDTLEERNFEDRKRYKRIKEQKLEQQKTYRKSEKGKLASKLKSHRRNSAKGKVLATLSVSDWLNVLDYFNAKCAYCGCGSKLEQEHFIPLTKGGGYTPDNIIPACRSCNASKYNQDFFVWYPKQKFYSEQRMNEIVKWLNIKNNEQQLSIL